jgi:hypothetical protein
MTFDWIDDAPEPHCGNRAGRKRRFDRKAAAHAVRVAVRVVLSVPHSPVLVDHLRQAAELLEEP